MDRILRADPESVKEAMERESREQAKERAAKGERKRGRKPKSKLAKVKFDTLEIEERAREFAGLMSLGSFQSFHDFDPCEVLELFLNLATIESMTTTRARGSFEIVYRLRFTAEFDDFCTALRAGKIDRAAHILAVLREENSNSSFSGRASSGKD